MSRDGCDDTQPCRQRYRCKGCGCRFDDLTGTVLAGHHQPLRMWVLCLVFMGLNLSNRQIALELGLSPSDAHAIGKLAERYLAKESKVYFESQIRTRKFQDQQGQDRYSTEIHLTPYNGTIAFLDRKRDGNGAPGDEGRGAPTDGAGGQDGDDDIPF